MKNHICHDSAVHCPGGRLLQVAATAAALCSILGCVPGSSDPAAFVQGNELTIPVPEFLLSARAITLDSLTLSVTAVSSTNNLPLQGAESVQAGGDRTLDFTVPYSGEVTLTIVWFHDDLEIARLTQTVPSITRNTIITISNSEYDTSADFDMDGVSNFRELRNDTDPYSSASSPALSQRVKKITYVGGASIEFQYDENGSPLNVLWLAPASPLSENGNIDTDFVYNQAGQLVEKKRYANPGITILSQGQSFDFPEDQLLETHRYTYDEDQLQSIQITESMSNDTFRAGFGNYAWIMVPEISGDNNRLGSVEQLRGIIGETNAASIPHITYQYGADGRLTSIFDALNSNTFTVSYDVMNRISSIDGFFSYRFEYEVGECELMDFNEFAVFFPLCYR